MVGMRMRVKHRIGAHQAFPQRLKAQIWSSINQNNFASI
jgi:hypothetical protein